MESLNKSWSDILPPKWAASALRIFALVGQLHAIRPLNWRFGDL